MAKLLEYKCPACGGVMTFDSASQKMKCQSCGTEMDITEFDTEDIITTSGGDSNDDPVTPEIPF